MPLVTQEAFPTGGRSRTLGASRPAARQMGDERVEPMRGLQRLSLRFRIAGGVLAGLVVLFTFFGLLVVRTINLSTDVALQERLRLAEITAGRSISSSTTPPGSSRRRRPCWRQPRTAEAEQQGARALRRTRRVRPHHRAWTRRAECCGSSLERPNGRRPGTSTDDEAVRAAVRSGGLSVVSPAAHGSPDRLIAIIIAPLPAGEDRSAGFLAGELRTSHARHRPPRASRDRGFGPWRDRRRCRPHRHHVGEGGRRTSRRARADPGATDRR